MSTSILSARVRQGIALMDLHHGQQWVWSVDPDTVDVADYCDSVLGQVYAPVTGCCPHHAGVHFMGIGETDCGLALNRSQTPTLNRLWAFAIRRLREQRPQEVAA